VQERGRKQQWLKSDMNTGCKGESKYFESVNARTKQKGTAVLNTRDRVLKTKEEKREILIETARKEERIAEGEKKETQKGETERSRETQAN